MIGPFALTANAGGPRFVTGTQFSAAQAGNPIAFRISNPLYYTDPGALSASVTHAQADAMVAAAAASWNIPTASLVLAQGGSLAQHVSAGNLTVKRTGVFFPADVDPNNYLSKPIAVIYDTDGSVTDAVLGSGASYPLGCRQTGVTESIDRFGPEGTIDHALLIVNGRCAVDAGPALLQLQYQVERAFGRILGLAWSQLNDNVFTSATQPTAIQVSNWPVMHPVDVICGPYTYQCMTSPSSLRPDDRSALTQLYPVTPANQVAGKILSASHSVQIRAYLQFPTGQGMDMVNVTVRRMAIGTAEVEPFQLASGVSGVRFQQVFANAVSGAVSEADNTGTSWQPAQALMAMPYVEVGDGATLFMQTEAINRLYTGEYAIGPYSRPPVTPSGSVQVFENDSAHPGSEQDYTINVADAAANCSPGQDGLEDNPIPADTSGWWNGLLCSVGHTSWVNAKIKGGRSWTVEIDALDESGALTLNKAQPVLGLWKSTDPTGTLPTVSYTEASMNASAAGVTQIRMPTTAPDASFRIAITDQFGGGRPDFLYRARILAADSLTPSIVASGGGQVLITGRGFQPGMQVLVNGAAATVLSSSATTLTARVPSMATAHGVNGVPLAVTVRDAATGGVSTITDALRYSVATLNTLVSVSTPASLKTGVSAATPFAVKVLGANGTTPIAGASVRLEVTRGAATLAACGTAATCTLTSDAGGVVRTDVTGNAAGSIELNATELTGGAAVSVTLTDVDPLRTATIADPPRFVAAGAAAGWTITLSALQDGVPAQGVPVTWSVSPGGTLSGSGLNTAASGGATTLVSLAAASGVANVTVTGCAWSTVCSTWQVQVIDPAQWTISITGGAGQSSSVSGTLADVGFLISDGAGHPVQGAPVTLYQTVDDWEGSCPDQGRCASASVLASAKDTLSTNAAGLLSIAPLRVPGVPQIVNLAAVAGTTGFVTLSIPIVPAIPMGSETP